MVHIKTMLVCLFFGNVLLSVYNESDWVLVDKPTVSKQQERHIPIMMKSDIDLKPVQVLPKTEIKTSGTSIVSVPVLQQKSDRPWSFHGTNLESHENGLIFGHPEIKWGNVRQEEGTNCAYHAVKNLDIMMSALRNPSINIDQELSKPSSTLNNQLNNLDELLQRMPSWTHQIYEGRKDKVVQALRKKSIAVPEHDAALKNLRDKLPNDLKSYVNGNDGHIKLENLDGSEVEKLLKKEDPALRNHVLVMEYIPGLSIDSMLTESMRAQIESFKVHANARLGIVWNEDGLGHWVAYVAEKRNGKITIYKMNSIYHKQPVHEPELFKLLEGR